MLTTVLKELSSNDISCASISLKGHTLPSAPCHASARLPHHLHAEIDPGQHDALGIARKAPAGSDTDIDDSPPGLTQELSTPMREHYLHRSLEGVVDTGDAVVPSPNRPREPVG